jgi:F0F1-type ATP synthase assembly protein I
LKIFKAGGYMVTDIIGVIIAVLCGFLVAVLNYFLSKTVLEKAPAKYSLITIVRQVLQIGFLVVVYFTGTKTQLADPVYLLIGAVLGMTIPMVYFTKKLLSFNKTTDTKKEEKEGEADG